MQVKGTGPTTGLRQTHTRLFPVNRIFKEKFTGKESNSFSAEKSLFWLKKFILAEKVYFG